MPLKRRLFKNILNMDYSLKFTIIETIAREKNLSRSSPLGTFNQEKETSQATRSKEKRPFSQTNIENKSEITVRKFVFAKCSKKITLGFHQKWN